MSKQILNNDEIEYFINLKPKEIDSDFMTNNFFNTINKNKKYDPSTNITIPKGRYHNNQAPIKTNIGLLVLNKLLFEEKLYDIVGYINDEFTSKVYGKIEDTLSKALVNDKITPIDMATFLNTVQWFGFQFNAALSPSITPNTSKPLKSVMDAKTKLIKSNKQVIESGNAVEVAKMQKQLLDIARKELKGDPGMDLYDSGSKASFDNNYASLNVMKGPIVDTSTGKYTIATSNYMNGIQKEEFHAFADTIVNGAYAKGKGTQVGGYMTKKYFATFQSLVLDKKDSDCGSKNFIEITLTESNYNLFLYRYMIDGNKFIILDDETIKKYIGRTVKLRDPMYCTSDKICNKCAGDLYYKLGIYNIGLTTVKVSSSLMQRELKKFHDTSVKLAKMDLNNLVL